MMDHLRTGTSSSTSAGAKATILKQSHA
uniref:Uncharacterized protein n=1 Tax=Rhizophora mucronata TaxID=61149 RepID=A0A2P2Q794_RHIMU